MAIGKTNICIKSNDGSTTLSLFYIVNADATITVTESGVSCPASSNGTTEYVYDGEEVFCGLATSAGATEPTLGIGKSASFVPNSTVFYYIVEEELPTSLGVTIEYNGSIVATVEGGNKATLPVKDKKMATDMVVTVPEGEVIPEFSEALALNGASEEEGEITIAYDLTEKVALPAATNKQLGTIADTNFIASNIKSGVSIFGLTGEYAGETVEEYDGSISIADLASLITFTIDGTEYQAEEGMTWAEWVESEYNTDGYEAGNNYVTFDTQNYYVTDVSPNDTIEENRAYSLTFFGTGGGGSN